MLDFSGLFVSLLIILMESNEFVYGKVLYIFPYTIYYAHNIMITCVLRLYCVEM